MRLIVRKNCLKVTVNFFVLNMLFGMGILMVQQGTSKSNVQNIAVHGKSMKTLYSTSNKNVSLQCIESFRRIGNDTETSLQYADAAGKPEGGLLYGNVLLLGSYSECKSLPGSHYCLIKFKTPKTLRWGLCVPKHCNEEDLTNGLNYIVRELKLKKYFDDVSSLGIKIIVETAICQEAPEYTTGVIITLALCSLILMLCLIGTSVDVVLSYKESSTTSTTKSDRLSLVKYKQLPTSDTESLSTRKKTVECQKKCKDNFIDVFLCFSLIRNSKRVMDTKVFPGTVSSFNGIRVLSITWVILFHTFSSVEENFSAGTDLSTGNSFVFRKRHNQFAYQALISSTFSVDSFFFMSGFLVLYNFMRQMTKTEGHFSFFKFFVHRLFRLIPTYWFLLLFQIELRYFLGEGPLWPQTDSDSCVKDWWKNILFINNWLGSPCYTLSWYVACDMQFYVLSPLIFIPAYRFKKTGLFATAGFFMLLGFVATGTIIGLYNMDFSITIMSWKHRYTVLYIQPYAHSAPYILGMVLAYIFSVKPELIPTANGEKIKTNANRHELTDQESDNNSENKVLQKHDEFPSKEDLQEWWIEQVKKKPFLLLVWCVALIVLVLTVYGRYPALKKNGRPFTKTENIVYGTFSRFSFTLVLAWVVFVCHTGNGGFVNKILSATFWRPIARLTYSAYLVNLLVVDTFFLSIETILVPTDFQMVVYYLGIVMVAYAASFILVICIEFPMMQLEKLIVGRLYEKNLCEVNLSKKK